MLIVSEPVVRAGLLGELQPSFRVVVVLGWKAL
jgi:hypothetical protein